MADIRQSAAYARYIAKLGWKVLQILNPPAGWAGPKPQINVFVRKLWIFGAIAKIQRVNFSLPWKKINKILKENRVWMCKIEPINITSFNPPLNLRGGNPKGEGDILREHHFFLDNWPMLATKTLRVDLTPTKEKILGQFKKDCRYILKKYSVFSIQYSVNKFEMFYKIWKKSAKRKSLWIPPVKDYLSLLKSFDKNCFCITIDDQAGAVILVHDSVAYYYYAGATGEGTKQNLPYLIVWKAMQEAKKRKCKIWDFEGIYDERWPNKGWKGFSHFKKSFGGYEVEFPGSFTKWF